MNTETITAAIQIAKALEDAPAQGLSPYGSIAARLVGTDVLIRTVTMTLTGHVEDVDNELIELSSAAWIADIGRFAEAIAAGTLSEVEPFPDRAYVNRGAVVDITLWSHPLPRTTK